MTSVETKRVQTPAVGPATSKEVTEAAAEAMRQLEHALTVLTQLATNPALADTLPAGLRAKMAEIAPALANSTEASALAIPATGTPFTGTLSMTKSRLFSAPSSKMDKIAGALEDRMAKLGLEGKVRRDDLGLADTVTTNLFGYSTVSIELKDQPRKVVNELLAFAREQGWSALR